MRIIIVLFFYSTASFAQLNDLCGIWVGHNYNCFTVNPDNTAGFYYLNELIEIKQNGTLFTAIKITGDDCVTAGQITLQGNYTQPTFEVSVTTGTPWSPNDNVVAGLSVTVIDNNTIESNFGPFYTRATCFQIDSFQVNLSSLNTDCSIPCNLEPQIIMPNTFTPNNDGLNDVFIPGLFRNIASSELFIYDRWGELVFKTEDALRGWDGKRNSANFPNGVYVCIINYTDFNNKIYTYKGIVTLLE